MIDEAPILEIVELANGLRLVGEIDASCAEWLSDHLDPLPGSSGDVILDLSAVEFIDSSGLRVLIDAHQRAERSERRVVMAAPSAVVRRLLDVSGLTRYLHVESV